MYSIRVLWPGCIRSRNNNRQFGVPIWIILGFQYGALKNDYFGTPIYGSIQSFSPHRRYQTQRCVRGYCHNCTQSCCTQRLMSHTWRHCCSFHHTSPGALETGEVFGRIKLSIYSAVPLQRGQGEVWGVFCESDVGLTFCHCHRSAECNIVTNMTVL